MPIEGQSRTMAELGVKFPAANEPKFLKEKSQNYDMSIKVDSKTGNKELHMTFLSKSQPSSLSASERTLIIKTTVTTDDLAIPIFKSKLEEMHNTLGEAFDKMFSPEKAERKEVQALFTENEGYTVRSPASSKSESAAETTGKDSSSLKTGEKSKSLPARVLDLVKQFFTRIETAIPTALTTRPTSQRASTNEKKAFKEPATVSVGSLAKALAELSEKTPGVKTGTRSTESTELKYLSIDNGNLVVKKATNADIALASAKRKQIRTTTETLKTIFATLQKEIDSAKTNHTSQESLQNLYSAAMQIPGCIEKMGKDEHLQQIANQVVQTIASSPDKLDTAYFSGLVKAGDSSVQQSLIGGYRNDALMADYKEDSNCRNLLDDLVQDYCNEATPSAEKTNILNFFTGFLESGLSIPVQQDKKMELAELLQKITANTQDAGGQKLSKLIEEKLTSATALESANPVASVSGFSLQNASPEQLAKDIGSIIEDLYLKVNPSEFDNQAFSSKNVNVDAPNLSNLATTISKISNVLIQDITLGSENIGQAMAKYEKLLDAALIAQGAGNHAATMAIVSALSDSTINRLVNTRGDDTGKLLSKNSQVKRDSLAAATSSEGSYKAQRGPMEEGLKEGKKAIPFPGLFYSDATFILDGNAQTKTSVNYNRITQMNTLKTKFQNIQANISASKEEGTETKDGLQTRLASFDMANESVFKEKAFAKSRELLSDADRKPSA